MANVAATTVKGNTTAFSGAVVDVPIATLAPLLPSFNAGGVKGVVTGPATITGTTFLKDDGFWGRAVPDGTYGDLIVTGNSWKLGTAVVLNSNLDFMPTRSVKGNTTNGTAAAADILIGNLPTYMPLFGAATNGVVQGPPTLTGAFLRDDGGWANPVPNGQHGDITISSGSYQITSGVIIDSDVAAGAAIDYNKLARVQQQSPALTELTTEFVPATTTAPSILNFREATNNGTGRTRLFGATDVPAGPDAAIVLPSVSGTLASNNNVMSFVNKTIDLSLVGNVISRFGSVYDGVVPSPGPATNRVLKDDGTWGQAAILDGTRGDIVVSGTGTNWQIGAGVITNADVSATAAIDASKLNGVQPFSVPLTVLNNDFLPAAPTVPAALYFREATNNGVNVAALQGPANLPLNVSITLPDTTGTLAGDNNTLTLRNKTISLAAGQGNSISQVSNVAGGIVPSPGSATGRYLKDDITWSALPRFTAAADGQVPAPIVASNRFLRDDGTWTTATVADGSRGDILVQSGGTTWLITDKVRGDITVYNGGTDWQITPGVITNADMQQMTAGTLKGNLGAVSAAPVDVPISSLPAQLPQFGTNTKGVVAGPTSITGKFLRDDGSWAAAGVANGSYGDITVSGSTWTINNAAVTNAKMAPSGARTLKGSVFPGPSAVADVPIGDITPYLSLFEDHQFPGNPGIVNASPGGTSTYLRANNTWSEPYISGLVAHDADWNDFQTNGNYRTEMADDTDLQHAAPGFSAGMLKVSAAMDDPIYVYQQWSTPGGVVYGRAGGQSFGDFEWGRWAVQSFPPAEYGGPGDFLRLSYSGEPYWSTEPKTVVLTTAYGTSTTSASVWETLWGHFIHYTWGAQNRFEMYGTFQTDSTGTGIAFSMGQNEGSTSSFVARYEIQHGPNGTAQYYNATTFDPATVVSVPNVGAANTDYYWHIEGMVISTDDPTNALTLQFYSTVEGSTVSIGWIGGSVLMAASTGG